MRSYISPEGRDARRKVREQKAERERERLLDKIVGAAYRKAEREKELTAAIKTVAAFLTLFTKQRRNDFSAEAITAAIDDAVRYPLELVTAALAELKASGDYDRILAERTPTHNRLPLPVKLSKSATGPRIDLS